MVESHEAARETHPLAAAEMQVPIRIVQDTALRAKVEDKCGFTCTFCHNEGTPVASDQKVGLPFIVRGGKSQRSSIYMGINGADFLPGQMLPDAEFEEALVLLRDRYGYEELHLTGGEPTLHPDLPGLIAVAKRVGYHTVGITSNGELGWLRLPAAAEAGLTKVNFSIFGTTPQELAETQAEKYQREELAKRKLAALDRSIKVAHEHKLKVSANIVVMGRSHIPRVLRLLEAYGDVLTIRLLNSLGVPESDLAIWELLESLGGRPIERIFSPGVSGYKIKYELGDGRSLLVKQIRPVYLPDTCASCKLHPDNGGGCEEAFYGLRLYKEKGGGYRVGPCIQRMDLTRPVPEFVTSSLAEEVMRLRDADNSLDG